MLLSAKLEWLKMEWLMEGLLGYVFELGPLIVVSAVKEFELPLDMTFLNDPFNDTSGGFGI